MGSRQHGMWVLGGRGLQEILGAEFSPLPRDRERGSSFRKGRGSGQRAPDQFFPPTSHSP